MFNSARKDFPSMSKLFKDKGTEEMVIRLISLLIGVYIPEGDETWEVLLSLKDVVDEETTLF